eukprot:TRINITY_DN3465_c0_g4_i1.p1 TRINITY_DN3465_c0_g4~~TRINITY_DN3465_c0_g4_i1.p1  ORF type:complete len:489 (+),score=47.86 TRINITY_DN3465_c0_g4_i1:55-1521(+)
MLALSQAVSLRLMWLLPYTTSASNPLVPHTGMADPHVHFFNGSIYMYATHDTFVNGSGCECCGLWWIWQSDDLVEWKRVSMMNEFPWADHDPTHHWATDAAVHNGMYYWYISVGGRNIAVVKGPTPAGPWSDPLGKFMLDDALGTSLNPPTNIRDPGVLQDEDGKNYIVFGACFGPVQPNDTCYYAAELNDDMTSTRAPQHLSVRGALGPYGHFKADDKPFLHKRSGIYYLSWGGFYATASAVYGPYTYQGTTIHNSNIELDFHVGNMTEEPWWTREIHQDRHSSYRELHGQWYFFANDRSHSDGLPTHSEGAFRQTIATYVHYFDNGTIAPIVINKQGVGSHDVSLDDVLPAENYFSIRQAEKKEGASGFQVVGLRHESVLLFKNIRNAEKTSSLVLRASNGGACRGIVSMHVGSVEESAVVSCQIAPTGAWDKYMDHVCKLVTPFPKGNFDLVLAFAGCGVEEFARLDHIHFGVDEAQIFEPIGYI